MKVCVLGSTGSIGVNTLDVLSRHAERFEVFALSAHTRVQEMINQCLVHRPAYAVMADAASAASVRSALSQEGVPTEVMHGARALEEVAAHPDVDVVMAAIVGAAGLPACLAAAHAGKRLLLANKEALVLGGAFFMEAVRQGGATLLPIDSEHSAIFQCLPQQRSLWPSVLDHIVLTASGGPFRDRQAADLRDVTPDEACAHPNWVMGRKISVDSATMMNKALEVIEARWLFDITPQQVRVVIHPQSVIHSMVVCRDGSVLAQLGTPDMRGPIAYGLSYPDRIEAGAAALDFASMAALTFREPDLSLYPGLRLAWEALAAPQGATAVLNAANEIAVQAFLCGTIRFDQIHSVNTDTLSTVQIPSTGANSLEDILSLDQQARRAARNHVAHLAR